MYLLQINLSEKAAGSKSFISDFYILKTVWVVDHPLKILKKFFLGHAVYDIYEILIYNFEKKEQKEISIFSQLVPL